MAENLCTPLNVCDNRLDLILLKMSVETQSRLAENEI